MKTSPRNKQLLVLGILLVFTFSLYLAYRQTYHSKEFNSNENSSGSLKANDSSRKSVPLSEYENVYNDGRDNPMPVREIQGKYSVIDSTSKLYESEDLGLSIIVPSDYKDTASIDSPSSAYYERPNGDFAYAPFQIFRPLKGYEDQTDMIFHGINIYKSAVREDAKLLNAIQKGEDFYDVDNSIWSPASQEASRYYKTTNYKTSVVNIGNRKFVKITFGLEDCHEGSCTDDNVAYYTLSDSGDIFYSIGYDAAESDMAWAEQKMEYEDIIKTIKIF